MYVLIDIMYAIHDFSNPMKVTQNPVTRTRHRYYWEFGLAIAGYVALVLLSRSIWHQIPQNWRVVVALSPMLPMALVFAAVVRHIIAMDELERQVLVKSLALAGGLTALIAVTYGLLEGGPLPRPSAWWTYSVFMLGWMISYFFVRRRYQ